MDVRINSPPRDIARGPCHLLRTSNPNPAAAPTASVTLTATVTSAVGSPTGTVQFYDNLIAVGTPVSLNVSGVGAATIVAGGGNEFNIACDLAVMADHATIRQVAQGSRRPARSGSGRLRARTLNYSAQRQKLGADTQMSLCRGFQVDLESKLILFNDEADHTPVRSKVLGLPHSESI